MKAQLISDCMSRLSYMRLLVWALIWRDTSTIHLKMLLLLGDRVFFLLSPLKTHPILLCVYKCNVILEENSSTCFFLILWFLTTAVTFFCVQIWPKVSSNCSKFVKYWAVLVLRFSYSNVYSNSFRKGTRKIRFFSAIDIELGWRVLPRLVYFFCYYSFRAGRDSEKFLNNYSVL